MVRIPEQELERLKREIDLVALVRSKPDGEIPSEDIRRAARTTPCDMGAYEK